MLNLNRVSFPGLGLEFKLNEIAFTLGGISVRWYGIILCVGIISAFVYFLKRASETEGIDPDHIYNITLITVIVAIIGARFTYVITNLDKYDNFWQMLNITEGGIAIYGAIIFGGVTVIIYSRIKELNTYAVLDSIAPAVMLGQIIGRWGNFVNAEAYGYSAGVEKLPWRMGIDNVRIDDVLRSDIEFVHPTFLYESLWNLLGFIIINLIYKKKKFNGQIFYLYILWYGIGRGFIEMLRTDSLYVFGLKLSVLIGFASFIIAIIMLIFRSKNSAKELENAVSYESKYSALKVQSEEDALKPFDVSDTVEEDLDNLEDIEEKNDNDLQDEDALTEQDSLDKTDEEINIEKIKNEVLQEEENTNDKEE